MTYDEMTIADVLRDPLIRQVMNADGVTLREMKKLLLNAASRACHHRNPEAQALRAPCR
jgi:hypothetical protein